MSERIYGDKKVIEKAKHAPAGDKSNHINWDAILDLPEEFEIVVTEIKYNPEKLDADFSEVGNGNMMPKPELMYKIAEACGISGGDKSITEPLIEEIDINPMVMKPITDEPTIRKMIIGRKVTKYSTRLQEDGTLMKSSPCTTIYNAYERCCEAWAVEEKWTEGYTKPGKYASKYDNQYKRREHFQSELKFAHAKAETKAYEKTIRELAGLQTGFKKEDLISGSLIFAKVRRSMEILKAESAARLSAMQKGEKPQNLLFAPTETVSTPATEPTITIVEDDSNPFETEPQKTIKDEVSEIIAAMEPPEAIRTLLLYYQEHKLISCQKLGITEKELQDKIDKQAKWLDGKKMADMKNNWEVIKKGLAYIEGGVSENEWIAHNIYKK